MYEIPIEKRYGEIQIQMIQKDENMVMQAVSKVGVNVDKEELIKALQYDRNQYVKGYEDGKKDVLNQINQIRAEILTKTAYESLPVGGFKDGYITAMVSVLNIIDKHMSEERIREK